MCHLGEARLAPVCSIYQGLDADTTHCQPADASSLKVHAGHPQRLAEAV